ncbi:MAG: hypothetical protein M1837_000175 [Sclerophora amabilis]|nr:MAG: hypothetical protein M1837_000175 [Sclerophora amabilis]
MADRPGLQSHSLASGEAFLNNEREPSFSGLVTSEDTAKDHASAEPKPDTNTSQDDDTHQPHQPHPSGEDGLAQLPEASLEAQPGKTNLADVSDDHGEDVTQLQPAQPDRCARETTQNINIAHDEPEFTLNERFSSALAEHHEALHAITRDPQFAEPVAPGPPSFSDPLLEEPTAPPLALENTPSLPVGAYHSGLNVNTSFEHSVPIQEPEGPQIQAFAKLEFDDGPYYMNTYSIELGRDVRAAKIAFKQETEPQEQPSRRSSRKSSSAGDVSQTPIGSRREEFTRVSRSILSESGGIMGMDSPDEDDEVVQRKSRRGSKKSKSTTSSSQLLSRKNSTGFTNSQTDQQSSFPGSLSQRTSAAHPVDPLSLLPSPDECPLLAIHPPADCAAGHKGISRKHVKIAYNFDRRFFELQIRGRNGAFVDDRWHAADETISLKSGSHIQIGAVGFRFALPDVPVGQTGAESSLHRAVGTDELALQSGSDDDEGSLLSRGSRDDEAAEAGLITGSEEDEGVERRDNGGQPDETSGTVESEGEEDEVEEEEAPSPEPVPKKRGPGRPPKNGISKREQAQIAREAKAKAKQREAAPIPPKNKVGRPRKNAVREEPQPKPEKRKYTKRKGVDPDSHPNTKTKSGQPETEEGNEPKAAKEKKKKPPRSPRSPTPEFDISKLPPEALEKPQSSYVVLIHEALSNSKTGAMSLPQIYKAIQWKYPFFVLRTTTNGWQSSVRHNLGQHPAFNKIERSGKGWMWAIVPGISIEKEKKRKSSPPQQAPNQYIQQQQLPHGYSQPPQPSVHGPSGSGSRNLGPPMQSLPPASHPGVENAKAPPTFPAQPYPNGGPKQTTMYQSPYATHSETDPSKQGDQRPKAQQINAAPQPHTPANPHATRASQTHPARPSAPPTTPSMVAQQQAQPNPVPQAQTAQLNPQLIAAVNEFKVALIKARPNDKRLEAVVNSAINRGLGLTDKSNLPGGEDPQERQIMLALWNIMKHHQSSSAKTAPQSSSTPGVAGKSKRQVPQQPSSSRNQPSAQGVNPHSNTRPNPSTPQSNNANAVQLIRFLHSIGKRGTPAPMSAPAQGSAAASAATPRPPSQGAPLQETSDAGAPVNGQGSPEPVIPTANMKRSLRSTDDGDGGREGEPKAKRASIGL